MGKNQKMTMKKLNSIIIDLEQMKESLVPDQSRREKEKEMKKLDAFGKKKFALNELLQGPRKGVKRLSELNNMPETSDTKHEVIKIKNECTASLKESRLMWNDLKNLFKTLKEKNKLPPEEIKERKAVVLNLKNEISMLSDFVAGKAQQEKKERTVLQQRADDRAAAREKRRKQRAERLANRKGGKGAPADDDDSDEMAYSAPATDQQQAFYDEKDAAMEKENQLLDEIGNVAENLKEMSLDMNKELKNQAIIISEMSSAVEKNADNLRRNNKNIDKILEESRGASTWCPRMICLIFVLAVFGYLFNMFS